MRFLMISILIPFLFAIHECHVVSRRDVDETELKVERQNNQKIDWSKQKYFEGDILLPGKRPFGQIQSGVLDNKIWPTRKIPYILSKSYTKSQVNLILDAMKAFKSKTCIEFIPRTTEKDYIDIKMIYMTCSSYVGRIGGGQLVSLDKGCLYSDIIKHELMHAAGFYHEQSRTDRDDFVRIYYNNIKAGLANQFEKYDSEAVQLLGTPYDIKSIMHYRWNLFAKDETKPTITDKSGNKVGPSDDFTWNDIVDLNRLYKCPKDSFIDLWKEQAGNNGRFVWRQGCDIVGNRIRDVTSSTNVTCGGLCAADLTCTHFTWQSNGTCTLKTAPKQSSETRPLNGATCGYITEGNAFFKWSDFNGEKYSIGCDFPGNDVRTVQLTTDDCHNLCISEPKCTNYVVRYFPGSTKNMNCNLKTGKSPVARAYIGEKDDYCAMIVARI